MGRALKTRVEVTPDKLRGGFYTPPGLVHACIARVAALSEQHSGLAVLEPSVGSGAFIHGLSEAGFDRAVRRVVGVEIVESEAVKAREALRNSGMEGDVHCASAIAWAIDSRELFDVAIGNPPFVRFQFISDNDKRHVERLGTSLGVSFGGVSNLWIPILLGALSRLRPGGVAAFVVPTECLTGVSAGAVRDWLVRHLTDVRLDLFPPGSYPGVLQEVLILSGRRRAKASRSGSIQIVEHLRHRASAAWTYQVAASRESWSRYLLDPVHLEAVEAARRFEQVHPLGAVAVVEVSIVTGANEYFSADRAVLETYGLQRWAKPLLPRVRNAPGIIFDAADHKAAADAGARAWLLHFGEHESDPTHHDGALAYLQMGEALGLDTRYKCRIRSPWYRVPGVRNGRLLLSKRSHRFHRLLLNEAGALTTDTIYRGWMRPTWASHERDLVAGFHNSLTLLTAELEGRSFGGGVLELVPSEISRLSVPLVGGIGSHLPLMDAACREGGEEALVEKTDALLSQQRVLPPEILAILKEGRQLLLERRLGRSARNFEADAEMLAA